MISTRGFRRRMAATTSWTTIGLALACSAGAASAEVIQTARPGPVPAAVAPQAAPSDQDSDATQVADVVVVGARAAQQSANDRKRRADTPTDSIVADDVGSFPDRNVNEAISRIPGVALGRNDYGEGESIAVRGNGPDLTRVELDGIGVQSTNGLAISADRARNADLRELPAELIESVDVVKGATASMTEGSLGGSVQIRTRSGLSFDKPYFSMRIGGSRNSIGQDITPEGSLIAGGRFLDGRLGVIASANFSNIQTNAHSMETTTSNNRGYDRLFDLDQSAEKTFTYNPDTVEGDTADTVLANSIFTPRMIVERAASAQTKAECFTLFPHLPTGSNNQRVQRTREQQSCLNQWNDYTPSNVRSFMNTQEDKRRSLDLRLDYKLTDDLVVWGKYNESNRVTDDQTRNRNQAADLIQQNVAGTFLISSAGYPRIRSLSPNAPAGYYLWDPSFGLASASNNAVLGNVLNVVPGSVTVDDNHYVTQMRLTNTSTAIDQISNINDTATSYMQVGADYKTRRIEANFMAGRTEASSTRTDLRTSRAYMYGDSVMTLQSNGLWGFTLPAGYDETNPANYVQLVAPACTGTGTAPNCIGQAAVAATINNPASPAYTVGQMPLTSRNMQVSFSPSIAESAEDVAKLDLSYRFHGDLPFISRIKTGLMYRNREISKWGAGGYQARSAVGVFGTANYVPPVVVPTANVRGQLRSCQETPGSTAVGGLSCNYGFVPYTNLEDIRSGVDTLRPEVLRSLLGDTLENIDTRFFGDYPERDGLGTAWQGIDVRALFNQLGASQFINFDCVKRCMGSDGQMYDQPVNNTVETIQNVYLETHFDQDLPWGLRFNGNVGVRGVHTEVSGVGNMTLNAVRVTPTYNPTVPNAPGGTTTQSFRSNVTLNSTSMDWLPSYNLNLWGFDDKIVLRTYGSKTIARPNITRMLPAGNCTIDERNYPGFDSDDDDTNGCSGRVGNPGLEPFTAQASSWNLEWYPNRDTTFSFAYHELDVEIGNPIGVTAVGRLFANSDQVDPISGQPVSELEFSYPTFANGPGYKRTGWEFSAKTAFTFLPSLLQYTGFDFNISSLSSNGSAIRDPLTGDAMPPPNESKYYTNLSIWYDDGRLDARVAVQNRTERFDCITPCSGNTVDINYPGNGYTNVGLASPGYNPGNPRFIDETTYVDFKMSYRITPSLQYYLEGRNLTREAQTISAGEYLPFADGTPRIMKIAYGGVRVGMGFTFKFGGK